MTTEQRAPFTSEAAASRILDKGADQSRVLWAERMVLSGFDCPALDILLGEMPPFDKFEMDTLFDKAARQLGLPVIASKEEALCIEASAIIRRFFDGGKTISEALGDLKELSFESRFPDLDAFYRLFWAKDDLLTSNEQHYWPDATQDTIDGIVTAQFTDFLDRHPFAHWADHEWRNTMEQTP